LKTNYNIFELIKRAKTYRPINPESSASSFAEWVFRLSHNLIYPSSSGQNKTHSRKSQSDPFVEKDIRIISETISSLRNNESYNKGWHLIYADQNSNKDKIFKASNLKVSNQVLRCKLDAVLLHYPTDEILIIERKIMGAYKLHEQIPTDSYPNIRAQLWCYSKIDDWKSINKITLMDEIWRRNKVSNILSPPKVRRTWLHTDPSIIDMERLFSIYSGY